MRLRELRRADLLADGWGRYFYGCTGFPFCKATHGAHPDGRPLGVPAGGATKDARIRAHAAFDQLWQMPGLHGRERRRRRGRAYVWLARQLGREEVHMGKMTIAECDQVIALCSGVTPDEIQIAASA